MKRVVLIIILTSVYFNLSAQINATHVSDKNDPNGFYMLMKNAFPLSFNDPESPRFIFFNDNKNFVFGVGGYVHLQFMYDFNGLSNTDYFVTSNIQNKGEQGGGRYGISIDQSRLFCKLIGDTKLGRIVTYMEMEFETEKNSPTLRHAFIKFKGFTLGKTWSTFCDIEAGPPTVDKQGPPSEVALRNPQIRYTLSFSRKIEGAIAIEQMTPSITNYDNSETTNQRIPDIPMYIRYKFNNGSHIQGGALFRNMYYHKIIEDKDKSVIGWGLAVSGLVHFTKKTSLAYQRVYGRGISNYVQDLTGLGWDLIPDKNNEKLKAPKILGFHTALKHYWNDDWYSSILYSYNRIYERGSLPETSYKYTHYASANLFWNFIEFGSIGLEYIYGRKVNFDQSNGNGNRINVMIVYSF